MAAPPFGNCSLADAADACGGPTRGFCVDDLCLCQPGWTGLSHFVNSDGFDCQVNLTAVKVLWGINLVVVCVTGALALQPNYYRVKIFFESRNRARQSGRVVSWWWRNRSIVSILCWAAVGAPSMLAFCLLMLFVPGQRVGVSFASTLLFATTRLGFYFGVYFFQPSLVASLLKGRQTDDRRTGQLVWLNFQLARVVLFCSVVPSVLPFITFGLDLSKEDSGVIVMRVGLAVLIVSIVMYAYQSYWLLTRSAKILANSPDRSEKLAEVRSVTVSSQAEAVLQAVVQGVVYLAFLFNEFMFNKLDYLLPLGWLAYPLLSLRISTSVYTSTETRLRARSSWVARKSPGISGDGWGWFKSRNKCNGANSGDTPVAFALDKEEESV